MEILRGQGGEAQGVPNFRQQVDIILRTHVSPENIATYASDALDGLVGLVDDVVQNYQVVQRSAAASDEDPAVEAPIPGDARTLEDNALEHFGLEGVECLLDHIAHLDATLHLLPSIIEEAEIVKGELLPPQKMPAPAITAESDDHDEKGPLDTPEPKPRLQTVLFILAESFGINLTDKDQLSLSSGAVNSRWKPYHRVQVKGKGLDHVILVCDAPENATFVLSRPDMERHEALRDPELFQKITKENVTDLITAVSGLGTKIRYSDNFTLDLMAALTGGDPAAGADQLLYPIASDEVKTEAQLNRLWGLGQKSQIIRRAAMTLGLYVQRFRFPGVAGPPLHGYGPNGQQRLHEYITGRMPPEDVVTLNALRRELSVAHVTLAKVVKITEDLLATPDDRPCDYLFGSTTAPGYDKRWKGRIAMTLAHVYPPVEPATEEILNIARVAECLHVHRDAVRQAINDLGPSFIAGTKVYGFGKGHGVRAVGYTPAQQQTIRHRLLVKGRIDYAWQFPFETAAVA